MSDYIGAFKRMALRMKLRVPYRTLTGRTEDLYVELAKLAFTSGRFGVSYVGSIPQKPYTSKPEPSDEVIAYHIDLPGGYIQPYFRAKLPGKPQVCGEYEDEIRLCIVSVKQEEPIHRYQGVFYPVGSFLSLLRDVEILTDDVVCLKSLCFEPYEPPEEAKRWLEKVKLTELRMREKKPEEAAEMKKALLAASYGFLAWKPDGKHLWANHNVVMASYIAACTRGWLTEVLMKHDLIQWDTDGFIAWKPISVESYREPKVTKIYGLNILGPRHYTAFLEKGYIRAQSGIPRDFKIEEHVGFWRVHTPIKELGTIEYRAEDLTMTRKFIGINKPTEPFRIEELPQDFQKLLRAYL